MNKKNNQIKIIDFLQWNDRNGFYTDKNYDLEKIPKATYEDAAKYFFSVISDNFYYKITINVPPTRVVSSARKEFVAEVPAMRAGIPAKL